MIENLENDIRLHLKECINEYRIVKEDEALGNYWSGYIDALLMVLHMVEDYKEEGK